MILFFMFINYTLSNHLCILNKEPKIIPYDYSKISVHHPMNIPGNIYYLESIIACFFQLLHFTNTIIGNHVIYQIINSVIVADLQYLSNYDYGFFHITLYKPISNSIISRNRALHSFIQVIRRTFGNLSNSICKFIKKTESQSYLVLYRFRTMQICPITFKMVQFDILHFL